jgi:intracellular sulfur oxidation DsrE/DsrF family protein
MNKYNFFQRFKLISQLLIYSLLFTGCGEENSPPAATEAAKRSPATETIQAVPSPHSHTQNQFMIDNKRYLFDVTDHSIEELQALLQRTEEISQLISDEFDNLEIVMILHGPDLDWFTQEHYDKNKDLVDLAARLDTLGIIDLKACATAMESRGIDSTGLPAFIEPVPYAPDEIARLQKQDYTSL